MICRKATVALPDANPLPSEHKIGIFVRFWLPGPSFSGVSLLLEEHSRVMEQFDSTFVVAHVLRIYDTAYCLKLHYGSGDIEGCSEYFYLNS